MKPPTPTHRAALSLEPPFPHPPPRPAAPQLANQTNPNHNQCPHDHHTILPAFTRVDAAAFFKLTPQIEAQINVENLLNSDYFSSAYNDNNIMPGAPTTVRATVRMRL